MCDICRAFLAAPPTFVFPLSPKLLAMAGDNCCEMLYVAHAQGEARPNRHAFTCYLSVLRVLFECIACAVFLVLRCSHTMRSKTKPPRFHMLFECIVCYLSVLRVLFERIACVI